MGLLDDLTYDPQMALGMGLLSAGGNSRMPVSFGQGLGSAWNNMQDTQRAGQKSKLTDQQILMAQMQMKKMQQDAADAEAARGFDFGKYYQTPQQQAIAQYGPTSEGAAAIPKLQPKLDTQGLIAGLMASKHPALMQQGLGMLTKEEAPITLAEGAKLITRGGREIAANPKNQDVKNGYLLPDGKGGWKVDPALFAAEKELKATAAPRISVSPTVKVGTTFAEGVAKQGADRLFGQIESAAAAPQKANAANQILTALDTGKVLAGPMTKWSIAARQVIGSDPEKLKATRNVIQGLAKISLEGRQSLRGQGALTDFEQRLLSSAESGDIDNLTVDEIRMIAQGARKNAQVIHAQGKKASEALKAMPEFKGILPAFDVPDIPEAGNGWSAKPIK